MKSEKIRKIFFVFLLLSYYLSLGTAVNAEVLDRVVAIVDDEAVMLSEFNEAFQKASSPQDESAEGEDSGRDITEEEVLNGLINRILLLKEAKRFGPAVNTRKDDNALINEYIEKRIKSFISIPFSEIETFYKLNKEFFLPQGESTGVDNNKNLYKVRDEIEAYLIEKELNKKLLMHIKELREKAYIKMQLTIENR